MVKLGKKKRKHSVICWIKMGRRVWKWQCAEKLRKSHQELFGHFGDWVTCRSLFILPFYLFLFYVDINRLIDLLLLTVRHIKRNGLKLFKVFNMPFGAILPALSYGKYVFYGSYICYCYLFIFYIFIVIGFVYY